MQSSSYRSEATNQKGFMNEKETAESQLALAETSYAKAKELNDHDSAYHCAETMAKMNRTLTLMDEQIRKETEQKIIV